MDIDSLNHLVDLHYRIEKSKYCTYAFVCFHTIKLLATHKQIFPIINVLISLSKED